MGEMTGPGRRQTWSDYPRFVRRNAGPLVVLAGLGALGGLALALSAPSTYSATASVVLAPVPVYTTTSTTELAPPEVSIDTDAQLLHSPRVTGAVARELGLETEAVEEHLQVSASPNTHVLHVTISAPSASAAAAAANAGAAQLAEVRRAVLGALQRDQLRQLRLVLSEHEDLLAQEQSRRLVIPSRDDLFHQILELRTGVQELIGARRAPVEVVRPARAPSVPDYANREVPITTGAMLGLLAGCLVGSQLDRARLLDQGSSRRRTTSDPTSPAPGITPRHEE
jgi:uncharacterized protein involved in exopolysaccharide biosynthesis